MHAQAHTDSAHLFREPPTDNRSEEDHSERSRLVHVLVSARHVLRRKGAKKKKRRTIDW